MRYIGGKHRIAKRLASAILPHAIGRRLVEPFCGGLSATVALQPAVASDASEPIINLWLEGRKGFIPKTHYTSQDYEDAKAGDPLDPAVAFLLQGGSYGGKWRGGLARNVKGETVTDLTPYVNAFRKKVEATRSVQLQHNCYLDADVRAGDVVYCDPPYAGVTQAYAAPAFDHKTFWDWVQQMSNAGCLLFVSEYSAPDWAEVCLEIPSKTDLRKVGGDNSSVERLYRVGN